MFGDVRLGPAFRDLVNTQKSPLREALLAEERRFADEIIQSMVEDETVIALPESLSSRALCFQIDLLRDSGKKFIEMAVYDSQEELIFRGDFPLSDEMRGFNFFLRYWEKSKSGLLTAGCRQTPDLMVEFEKGRKNSHSDGTGLFAVIGEDMGLTLPHNLSRQLFEFTANLWPHKNNPFPQYLLPSSIAPYSFANHYA